MTGDPLPDTDHVVRYCPPLRTENGLPTTAAFQPRGGEHYISTNWLEFFKGADMATNLKHVRVAVGAKLTLRPLAEINLLSSGFRSLFRFTSVPQSQAQASASCGRARSGGEWVVKRSSRGRRSKMLSCSTCSIWLRLQRSRRTNLR